jgi:tRNA pseudouridine55 synthase
VHLGITTTTGDTEGDALETKSVDITEEQIRQVLKQFTGPIAQVPPMYSALKRDGKPLYEYARAGVTLEREARHVVIHELEFLAYDAPLLSLKVKCSKGTYVRVLGEDIGAALGCGAHLKELRRIQVGHLVLEKSITLDFLESLPEEQRLALLDPVDALLSSFPVVHLNQELARRFLHGQRLALGKETVSLPQAGRVRVYRDTDGQLLGSAYRKFGILAPERLINTQEYSYPYKGMTVMLCGRREDA